MYKRARACTRICKNTHAHTTFTLATDTPCVYSSWYRDGLYALVAVYPCARHRVFQGSNIVISLGIPLTDSFAYSLSLSLSLSRARRRANNAC